MITDHTITVNDLQTRYLSGEPDAATAQSPTVVFLHDGAWGASGDVTWGDLLPLAAARFRVIAPDLLGFGGSAKSIRLDQSPFGFRTRHLWALLDALGIAGPVHLVGCSFGGSVGLRALTDPASLPRIASVTSISGTGGPWRSAKSNELGPFDGTERDIRRIVELICGDGPFTEAQVAARYRWATVPGHYASVMAVHQSVPAALQVARPADPYPANLAGIDVPVLLVAGTEDPLVEPEWTQRLCELLPRGEVAELPYRHEPNITHPEQTWQVIEDFLTRSGRRDIDAAR